MITPVVAARASFSAKATRTCAYGIAPRAAAPRAAAFSSMHSLSATGFSLQRLVADKTRQPMQFFVSAMSEEEGDAPAPAPPVEESKLYVGNLSWGTESEDLREIFSEFGEVQQADVVMDPNGRSRGFGFVTMSAPAEAVAATEALNSTEIDGRTVRVDKVLPPGADRPVRERRERTPKYNSPNRLYVGNLPWKFDDYDLEDAFAEFGEIVDAKVMYDRDDGRSRGFGFVTLASADSVDEAISALDGADVDGRQIRVNRADRS